MDAARRVRDSSPNSSDDKEFDTVIKNARTNLETHLKSAMLCNAQKTSEKTLNKSMSTSKGDLVPKHSWERPHAPKLRKHQIQFMLTNLMLTNLDDAVSMKAASTSTKSYCRPWIEFYESLQYGGSYADTFSESNEHSGIVGGIG